MSPNPPPAAELLAAHAASLRALARHLVGDPHAAEDVVQDTWVRALECPPARMDALGGWLRTVLRNVVTNRRRGEARRTAREAVTAQSEVQAGAPDARARTLRAVVDAVLALDEPYRGTVLARYFEDLPPREIARREGISVHTIESRLQRALTRLRGRLSQELEDEVGGARHGLLLLAGLRPDGAGLALGAATATGAVIVGTQAKVAFAGASAALAMWLLWLAWPEPGVPVVASAPQTREVVTRTPMLPEEEPAPVALVEPEPPAPPQAGPVPSPPSRAIELSVLVTTDEGLPLPAAAVLAAPDRHALNDVATTGPDGLAEVRIPVTVPRLDLVVAAWHPEHGLAGPWRFEANTRDTTEVTLSVHSTRAPVSEEHLTGPRASSSSWSWSHFAGPAVLEAMLRAPLALRTEGGVQLVRKGGAPLPRAELLAEDSQSILEQALPTGADGFTLELGWDTVFLEAATELLTVSHAARPKKMHPSRTTRLVGVVQAADGRPVAGAVVAAGDERSGLAWQVRTDELGVYGIDGVPLGPLRVVAFAPGLGRDEAEFVAAPGPGPVWDARLDAGLGYESTLFVRGEGVPPARQLEWVTADRGRLDVRRATTGDGGAFAFTHLSKGRAALMLSGPDLQLPLLVAPKLRPGPRSRDHSLQGHSLGTGELRVRGVLPMLVAEAEAGALGSLDPWALLELEARVWTHWKLPAERMAWMNRGDAPDLFVLDGLPPGRYRVEVGSCSRGWVESEPVELGPGETLDLGALTLPRPGFVVLKASGSRRLVRRGEVETLIAGAAGSDPWKASLAPGEYLFFDPDDRSRGYAFTLATGEMVVIGDAGVISREPLR